MSSFSKSQLDDCAMGLLSVGEAPGSALRPAAPRPDAIGLRMGPCQQMLASTSTEGSWVIASVGRVVDAYLGAHAKSSLKPVGASPICRHHVLHNCYRQSLSELPRSRLFERFLVELVGAAGLAVSLATKTGMRPDGTRGGSSSYPPTSSRARNVHRINDLHPETGGVPGRLADGLRYRGEAQCQGLPRELERV